MKKPTIKDVEDKLRAAGVDFDSTAFAPSIHVEAGSIAVLDGKPIELREVTCSRMSGRVISMASWAEAHAVMELTGDAAAAHHVLDFGHTRPRKGKCRIVQNGPVWRYRFTEDGVTLILDKRCKKDHAMLIVDFKLPVDWIVAVEKAGDVKTMKWSEICGEEAA